MNTRLLSGIYKHYKGGKYVAQVVARHSETLEEMVVYHELGNPANTWVRPLKMFLEKTTHKGRLVDRFQYIGSKWAGANPPRLWSFTTK